MINLESSSSGMVEYGFSAGAILLRSSFPGFSGGSSSERWEVVDILSSEVLAYWNIVH